MNWLKTFCYGTFSIEKSISVCPIKFEIDFNIYLAKKENNMFIYVNLIREVVNKFDKDFHGNLDFVIAELYNLSLRLKQEKELIEKGITIQYPFLFTK